MIEGARRVGKSTIVESFAKNEYATYILIDFSVVGNDIKILFDDMSNLNYFFTSLQLYFRVELKERNSVIIFDEVQLCPKARQAIKSLEKMADMIILKQDHLSPSKRTSGYLNIPSEEQKIQMNPMDYENSFGLLEIFRQ